MNKLENLMPSNRKFGYFFTLIFALAGSYFAYKFSFILIILFAVLACITLLCARFFPILLAPFNKLWFKLGLLLNKIVSPIILGVIFFTIFVPIGVFMRLFGRDELRMKLSHRKSHWKDRIPAGPEPETFKDQF
jgi:hypothetical protein